MYSYLCLLAEVIVLDTLGDRLPLQERGYLAKVLGVEEELLLEDVLLGIGPRVDKLPLLVFSQRVEDQTIVVFKLAVSLVRGQ